ncbi:Os01g0126000, partial [Oryza sativa Japonica Group]
DGAVGVEAPVGEHEDAVELIAAGEAERRLHRRVADDVGAEESGEEVGAGEAEGVVVVPEHAGGLRVGVGVRRRRPRRAGLAEAGGEPGEGAAIGLRRVGAAVEVDDGGDAAAARDGGGHGGVPREDVARGEVVLPRH